MTNEELISEIASRDERIQKLLSLLADTQLPLYLSTRDVERRGMSAPAKAIAAEVLNRVKEALDER
jgi:hypothetical protein